ncbi:Mg-dependent DNase [Entomoplasma ellychniae]|uniref:Mg-dependent DNase n=2 Tax=Entomoplasmataceae TaxID=33925 RepID=A0A2S5RH43_9MOLU|nr:MULTISPECIES: TatD family hydrolase [Entomoplasmataceae]PPE04838.1 Mg-dependent DNase [Entomoplasma ellychniae]PPE06623.1 Mg-dependent DNase [Mesoplasma corruscae]
MAGIYDTHCHLNDNIYIENEISSAEMAKEAKINGVDFINNVGYDIKSSKVALVQAQKNKNVFALVGIHPTQAHLFTDEALETLNTLAHADKVVGIGETGLDYFREGQKYKEQQIKFLRAHIKIAKKMKLALSLHIKDKEGSFEAYKDVLKVLKEEKYFKAVVHSFHSTLEVAEMFMEKGIFIAINGHVTKDNQLQKVVKDIPMNFLVVESDAPYETPKPYAKKTNAPKYIGLVVDSIANIKKLSKDNIAEITADNAKKLFWNK